MLEKLYRYTHEFLVEEYTGTTFLESSLVIRIEVLSNVHVIWAINSTSGDWWVKWVRTQAQSQVTWNCLPAPPLTSRTSGQEIA